MADAPGVPTEGTKKKGGLITFIKKNPTLSAVVGIVAAYVGYKELHKSEGTVPSEESGGEASGGGAVGEAAGVAQLAAYEQGREERGLENAERTVQEIEEEREKEHEEAKRRKEELEPLPEQGGGEGTGTGAGESPGKGNASGGVTIHGRNFAGATSSRIAKSGKTQGGKPYIEYVISFPGRQEHWQFFTDTGNWRQVSSSAAGAGANKPTKGSPKQSTPTTVSGQSGKNTGGGSSKPPINVKTKPKAGVGSAQVATAPTPVATAHPNAVKTGNKCVNGGIGKHAAPAGYHLFCGSDGWIYRAPN